MKRIGLNIITLLISIAFSLSLGELLCQIVLNPADYLYVDIHPDPILGHKIPDGQKGYDEWGFRNEKVPDSTEIVAIGDSQTFGENATSENAWPSHLARISGKKVYNMSLGAYGPAQYSYLLMHKALQLKPKKIIIGFYPCNDFYNASAVTYSIPYWHSLRDSTKISFFSTSPSYQLPKRLHVGGLRRYLAHNSIFYNLIARHKPIFLSKLPHIRKGRIWIPTVKEGFDISQSFYGLDIKNERVTEGFRLTKIFFQKMKSLCDSAKIGLHVAIIPVKESVFKAYLPPLNCRGKHGQIMQIINNEHILTQEMISFFSLNGIHFTQALPAMQNAASMGVNLYGHTNDLHPAAQGYKVIAEAIANDLKL